MPKRFINRPRTYTYDCLIRNIQFVHFWHSLLRNHRYETAHLFCGSFVGAKYANMRFVDPFRFRQAHNPLYVHMFSIQVDSLIVFRCVGYGLHV